jgi:hypothetical protein
VYAVWVVGHDGFFLSSVGTSMSTPPLGGYASYCPLYVFNAPSIVLKFAWQVLR